MVDENPTLVTGYVQGNIFHLDTTVVCKNYDEAVKLMENYGARFREEIVRCGTTFLKDLHYHQGVLED